MQTKEEIEETYKILDNFLKDDIAFKENVRKIFMGIDTDSSGALDESEVKKFIKEICGQMGIKKAPSDANITLIFQELDKDKSNSISVEELGLFMRSLFEQMRHDIGKRLKTMGKH